MLNFIGESAVLKLIKQSDAMSFAVLVVLFLLSVTCWAFFIGKFIVTMIKKRQLRRAIALVNESKTVDDLRELAIWLSGTLPGYFVSKSLVNFKLIFEQRGNNNSYEHKKHEVDLLRYEIDRSLDNLLDLQETYMPFFLTTASVAPLIGLLGTMWGLIHSLMRISQYQTADIVTVAPGVAEALIATLVGLLVAIPALVMHNYSLTQIRFLENRLQLFADKVGMILIQALIS